MAVCCEHGNEASGCVTGWLSRTMPVSPAAILIVAAMLPERSECTRRCEL
jgi:hypothetical protein